MLTGTGTNPARIAPKNATRYSARFADKIAMRSRLCNRGPTSLARLRYSPRQAAGTSRCEDRPLRDRPPRSMSAGASRLESR